MSGELQALAYIGLDVSDIAAWRAFAESELGLQWAPRADGTVDLRIDPYATRIRLHHGPRDDLAYAGWEVRDQAALDWLAARLEGLGVAVARGAAARRLTGACTS